MNPTRSTPERLAGGTRWAAPLVLLGLACGGGEGNQTPVTPGTPRVSPKELRGLEVTLARNDLRVGQVTGPALAYGRYDDGTTGLVEGAWTSSDSSVVEVGEDGTLTGVAVGRVTVSASFEEFGDSLELEVLEPNPRHERDQPDDLAGAQVHVVYAVPSDAEDGNLDRYGDIERSLEAMQHWLGAETGQRLRLDTAGGRLDVTFLRLPFSAQEGEERGASLAPDLEGAIRDRLGTSSDKTYAVYYAGRSGDLCGTATVEGRVAVAFVHPEGCSPRAVGGDRETPSTYETVMLHELLHVFGAVPECAPDRLETSAHVGTRVEDLMYAGPEWSGHDEVVVDAGRDDYFGHGRPDCLDTAASEFWEPAARVEARVPGAKPPRPVMPSADWPVRCGLLPRPAEAGESETPSP
ncbi:MAG: Ig-like domain-containing protein [Acidobacteriota bacterium]|nr:Ig-like domain-containing protein [Acidobacteriota bacterium]MDE3261988.1 Ig-like domain-containing protein [Acidobacteriota bacterium]